MTLAEFQQLLAAHPHLPLHLLLPGGSPIPVSFHVTEVGRVDKQFIDCGGQFRSLSTCQLQIWLGPDDDHRLDSSKLSSILAKAGSFLTDTSLPLEFEYEDSLLSQYSVANHQVTPQAIILTLTTKHTACLAPEKCGLPAIGRLPSLNRPFTACNPSSGCC